MSKLISVIIPAYNAADYLAEAIQSIRAQEGIATEIIISDDGSTDGTAQVAAQHCPEARYLSQPNGGPASALNAGVRESTGDYLAFLSADDVWVPQKLQWQLDAWSQHSDCEMLFGHMQHFHSPELTEVQRTKLHCPPEPMPAMSAGTLLISREHFLQVGSFDPQWRVGEFMEWYGRAKDMGFKSFILPQVLSMRRVHGSNHTVVAPKVPQSYAAMLKATLDRRRRESTPGSPPQ